MATGLSMRLASEATNRGLSVELLTSLGVQSRSGNGGEYLEMPFFRQGKLCNRKYRTSLVPGDSGGKSWQDGREKKAIRLLYNEDALRRADLKGQPVIITEGEPDAWAAIQAGFARTVGWPDGAPEASIPLDSDSPKYQPLDDARELFSPENLGSHQTPIIIAADGDEAGKVLLHDLSLRLGRARCKFLTYPRLPAKAADERCRTRCKDLGEVLEFYGEAGVQKTIERAAWVSAPGVYRMSELPPRAKPAAFDIGMPMLRDSFRMRLGDWSVWTGIPGHGKSTLVNDVCCRVITEYSTDHEPLVVTAASFEQEPQIDHRRNLQWWLHKKHPLKQSEREIENADWWIDQHWRFLKPEEDEDVTLDWALENLATAVVREGSKVCVLDPWNEMDHARAPGESVTEYTGRAIKAFRRFARKMDVHLIVVAHPTKMQHASGDPRSMPVPSLYSISDSAHWYNKCDAGIIVHRYEQNTMIWVQKTRYHDEIGAPCAYDAAFHQGERRYEIIGKHDWSAGGD
jgi:twinkle protein